MNQSLSRRIADLICSVPAIAPPIANGMLAAIGLALLTVRRFATMRALGLEPVLKSIAIWAGFIAFMAIASAAFLVVKRMVPILLARWRLLAAGAAIVLWSIIMAGVGAVRSCGEAWGNRGSSRNLLLPQARRIDYGRIDVIGRCLLATNQ